MPNGEKNITPEKYIIDATGEIFSTMLMMEVHADVIADPDSVEMHSDILSIIGLGGALRGMVAIHCPAETAKKITAFFLDMEITELDDDVKDAIGEIANMVAGGLKTFFAEAGINTELALPSSVVGHAIKVRGYPGVQRCVVSFTCDAGPFWVELLYVIS